MPISFFSPIYSDKPHPLEKCAFLRPAVNFFNFGQKTYTIRYYDNNQKLEVMEIEGKPSWIGTLLRVAAFATLIIPLFMLLGALVYRAKNNFEVYLPPASGFNDLPSDVKEKIFQMTGPSILQLRQTSKANNEMIGLTLRIEKNGQVIECDNPLKKIQNEYQLLLGALKQCYEAREFWPSADPEVALKGIALSLAMLDSKSAIKIAGKIKLGRKEVTLLISLK